MSLFTRKPKAKKEEEPEESAPEIALAMVLPEWANHPNRIPFEGVLTFVDEPSDKAPSGAHGHRVILTRAAALQALPSLLGMAVGYKDGWGGHNERQRFGIISSTSIVGCRVMVGGWIFCRDYPEIAVKAAAGQLGMSYELADAHVDDFQASIWTINRCIFVGAAALLREKAAYRRTSFTMTLPAPSKRKPRKSAAAKIADQYLSIT